jgi:LPXTG-motif cell wall-anchored protein
VLEARSPAPAELRPHTEESIMRTRSGKLSGIIGILTLGFAYPMVPVAQTTISVDEQNFEIVAVEGNKLVVRNQKGTHQYTVPDDFRFSIDGKKMAVGELKAGMKGSATVTTTTTIKPVVITEVRDVEVLRASDLSVTVRDAAGESRRYSQGELDTRGIQIVKDGQPIRVSDLRRGDKLTASIITAGAPVALTEKEVQATLAESSSAAPPMQVAAAPPPTQTATAASTSAPSSPPATASPSQPMATTPPPPSRAADSTGLGMTWYVLIAVLIALALFVFMRRKKAS